MKYVALLRGIGPSNPNMHGAKLKDAFEKMGFTGVAPVISSGNVIFDASIKDEAALEKKIETALPKLLGFSSLTFVRSRTDLEALMKKDPYKKIKEDKNFYPLVTFLKSSHKALRTFPRTAKGYGAVGAGKRELFGYVDRKAGGHAVDYMAILEKTFSKDITSRTWLTVGRILKKMDEA